jgi:hypothetical protein
MPACIECQVLWSIAQTQHTTLKSVISSWFASSVSVLTSTEILLAEGFVATQEYTPLVSLP